MNMEKLYGITEDEAQAIYSRMREVVLGTTPEKAHRATLEFAMTLTPREAFIIGVISGMVTAEASFLSLMGVTKI